MYDFWMMYENIDNKKIKQYNKNRTKFDGKNHTF